MLTEIKNLDLYDCFKIPDDEHPEHRYSVRKQHPQWIEYNRLSKLNYIMWDFNKNMNPDKIVEKINRNI